MDEILDLCCTVDWETVPHCQDYVVRILISGIVHRDFSLVKAMETAAVKLFEVMDRIRQYGLHRISLQVEAKWDP